MRNKSVTMHTSPESRDKTLINTQMFVVTLSNPDARMKNAAGN